MAQYLIFIVNDKTWEEHYRVGIAGINDPMITHPNNINANAARQSAISEISSIRPGDIIYFNRMVSENHPPELIGIFKATSKPYFDPNLLYPSANHVNQRLPFRVEFECLHHFKKPVNIDEVWILKDKGKIWTLQQSRGDAVGNHACVGITKIEAKYIENLLIANNITKDEPINYTEKRREVGLTNINKRSLPIDFNENKDGQLHYEAVFETLLLQDFANGKHKEIFGDYSEFIPYVPTGARKEIDILLLKYDCDEIIWYQILELKPSKFTMKELQRLIDYEKWFIDTKAKSPIQVHPVGIAYEFNDDVIGFVNGREKYRERTIRLIRYSFNRETKAINLEEI